KVFERLEGEPVPAVELREELGLAERSFVVLSTALRAMGLVTKDDRGRFGLTEMAREYLVPGSPFDMSGYVRLAAKNPSVLAFVERLRANIPQGHVSAEERGGTAFIYREGTASAMDEEKSARDLTLSLAGRARNVAPYLAERVSIKNGLLLDIGGGSGIYAYAFLEKNPDLRAVILDRAEVLKV